jgi:predicted nucleic acid-binding Zn ribbon protein
MSALVQNPFSTALAAGFIKRTDRRDIDLADAYTKLTGTEQTTKIAEIVHAWEDDVLDMCRKTMANLESTVNSVLLLQAQLKTMREDAAPEFKVGPVGPVTG